MERETNFFDLCVACGHAIGRGCKAFGRLLAHMLRLSVHYWWIVLPIWGLATGLGFYLTRFENTEYNVRATVLLNGASIQQFEQAYAPLRTGLLLKEEEPISGYVWGGVVSHFNTYRVVDAKHDGMADYVDYRNRSSETDTTRVQMMDRLGLEFRVKAKYISAIPEVEKYMMEMLNKDESLQAAYIAYKLNLEDIVALNHERIKNYAALEERYCKEASFDRDILKHDGKDLALTAEEKVNLSFGKDIDDFLHNRLQQDDLRNTLATDPVTLENHFYVDPKPLNGRRQQLPKYFLIGWILGCMIAQLVYKRKAIRSWTKLK